VVAINIQPGPLNARVGVGAMVTGWSRAVVMLVVAQLKHPEKKKRRRRKEKSPPPPGFEFIARLPH